jgi:hypothetical protein
MIMWFTTVFSADRILMAVMVTLALILLFSESCGP